MTKEKLLTTSPYFVGSNNANQFGSFWDDIGVSETVQSYIDQGKEAIVDTGYVTEEQVAKYSDTAEGFVESLSEKAQSAGTDLVVAQMSKYASDPAMQDKAAGGAFDATAARAKAAYMASIQAYRTGGIRGVYQKYPIPFYIVGGVASLVLAKFLIGGTLQKIFISRKYAKAE